MTDQPYQPYQQHPPYPEGQDGQEPHGSPQPAAWPGQQPYPQEPGYGRYEEQPYDDQQYTQQWQGQTWETSTQPPVTAAGPAETSYLPPTPAADDWQQAPQAPYAPSAYGQPVQQYPDAQSPAPVYTYPAQHAAPQHTAQPYDAALPPAEPVAAAPAAPQAAASGQAPEYGPATLAGNARVTDAQRARLEGRSPVIEPGMQPAALTALLGLLLSGTAALGTYALLVPLVVLQAVTAAGWFRLNGMWPARQGIALAFLGALVSDAALLVAGRDNGPAAILSTLGVWVLLCLVLQLRSHADPDERMYGLMATVASSALAILATGWLAAEPDAVTVGAAAVAVALVARALPLPTPASVVVALLAAAGAGIAVGGLTDVGARGALLGAGAAVCALIGHRVASYDYPSRFVHFTAGVALPLAAAAPAVYLLGRALV
ncbi:hypothetical protein [Streptomyces longwoodensis]|uniref:hypothetical protein n=1 Tax=Streptomyces longwoodensis TaxID=68231 RepID=UPI00225AA30F|nr:hypothetical protein [Streptomyces longwoodensis]MCX4994520.1 hypothetical protein [Streptomyces longwoodensis]